MAPSIVLTDAPDPAVRDALLGGVISFNGTRIGPDGYRPLAVLLDEPGLGTVAGGLWGSTYFGWLCVELLFVPEALRGRGLGAALLRCAEGEAVRRGCRGAWLDTFSFQARGFHERFGYAAFGALQDYPPGHSRVFLCKLFRPEPL